MPLFRKLLLSLGFIVGFSNLAMAQYPSNEVNQKLTHLCSNKAAKIGVMYQVFAHSANNLEAEFCSSRDTYMTMSVLKLPIGMVLLKRLEQTIPSVNTSNINLEEKFGKENLLNIDSMLRFSNNRCTDAVLDTLALYAQRDGYASLKVYLNALFKQYFNTNGVGFGHFYREYTDSNIYGNWCTLPGINAVLTVLMNNKWINYWNEEASNSTKAMTTGHPTVQSFFQYDVTKQFIFDCLIHTPTGPNRLIAGLKGMPSSVVLAHKTGTYWHDQNLIKPSFNDVGIVYNPDKHRIYLISTFVQLSSLSMEESEKIIAQAAKIIVQ